MFARWRRDRRVGYRAAKEAPETPVAPTGVPDGVVVPTPAPAAPSLQPASTAANSTEAGTEVSDAFASSEKTAPVDLDVGEAGSSVSSGASGAARAAGSSGSTEADPDSAAETKEGEAAQT